MRNDLDRRIDRRVDYSIEESAAVLLIRAVDFNWHLCQFFFMYLHRTCFGEISGYGHASTIPEAALDFTCEGFFCDSKKNLRWTWVAFFCTTSRILDF